MEVDGERGGPGPSLCLRYDNFHRKAAARRKQGLCSVYPNAMAVVAMSNVSSICNVEVGCLADQGVEATKSKHGESDGTQGANKPQSFCKSGGERMY